MRKRVEKFFYVSIPLTAVAVSTGGNQVEPDRSATLGDRNDVVNGACKTRTVGTLTVPQFEDNGANVWINRSHAASARLGSTLNCRPVLVIGGVAPSLHGGVTRITSSVMQGGFKHPRFAAVAPFFTQSVATLSFREGRSGRSQFRKATGLANGLESVASRTITGEHRLRNPSCASTASLQSRSSSSHVFIEREANRSGGVFDCSEV